MPKGLFTQCVCLLLERPVSRDVVEAALSDYEIRGRHDAAESWVFGGPSLTIGHEGDSNGAVVIDVVDQVWPDEMGDPDSDPTVFGGWTMGQFGPFAYPLGLERSSQQCWSWDEGESIAERHKAFVRIRSSFGLSADDDDPIIPDDYVPLAELEFVTRLATTLLELPEALCYFNPNGEVLLDADGLRENLNHAWANGLPPLNVWSNVRLFNVDEDWVMMDTVGNDQLDIPDVEACFHADSYELGEIDNFLRNISDYLLQNGDVINDGDTIDGPGDIVWRAQNHDNGVCDPPRGVLSWLPADDRPVPDEIQTVRDSE